MKSVASGDRLVANINEAEFKPWVCEDGSVDHSQTVLQLNTARPFGVGFHLYRMAPGTTAAAHRHTGDEEFFVLDGDRQRWYRVPPRRSGANEKGYRAQFNH